MLDDYAHKPLDTFPRRFPVDAMQLAADLLLATTRQTTLCLKKGTVI